MYCSQCGHRITIQVTFCPDCGAWQPVPAAVVQTPLVTDRPHKSRLVAGLLGIFLGYLGLHRFYLGYVSIGVVQIIVTLLTLGVGGLWGFVEGVLILTGKFNEDVHCLPLRG